MAKMLKDVLLINKAKIQPIVGNKIVDPVAKEEIIPEGMVKLYRNGGNPFITTAIHAANCIEYFPKVFSLDSSEDINNVKKEAAKQVQTQIDEEDKLPLILTRKYLDQIEDIENLQEIYLGVADDMPNPAWDKPKLIDEILIQQDIKKKTAENQE